MTARHTELRLLMGPRVELARFGLAPLLAVAGLVAGLDRGGVSKARAQLAFEVSDTEKTITITRAGQALTVYRYGSVGGSTKPYFWPLMGPHGQPVTRAFPNVAGVAGETTDHPHHRGLHFTHGEVALAGQMGFVDFWLENAKSHQGQIVHQRFALPPRVNPQGVLEFAVVSHWTAPDGQVLVVEQTHWTLRDWSGTPQRPVSPAGLLITATVTLAAGPAGQVRLLDSKEGALALRVASSMDENQGRNDKRPAPQRGRITAADGRTGEKAVWSLPADWVDYSGPVSDQTVGVAIFDHPTNQPRCRWHVRGYGLFAANPFGDAAFDKTRPRRETVIANEHPLTLQYGVYVHPGDVNVGQVAEAFANYVQLARQTNFSNK